MPEAERSAAIDAQIQALDAQVRARMKPGDLLHGTSLEDLRKIIADGFMREGLPEDGYPPGVWAHRVTPQDRQAKYLQALLYAESRAKHNTRSAPVILRIRSTRASPLKFSGTPYAMNLTRGRVRLENLELFDAARSAWTSLAPRPSEPGWRRLLTSMRDALNGAPGSRARWLKQAAALGLATGSLAPVLWKAAPVQTLQLTLPLAVASGAVLLALSALAVRLLGFRHRLEARAPPSRRAKLLLAAAGLAIGLSLSASPHRLMRPLIETATVVAPSHFMAGHARLAGPALSAESKRLLEANPVGRQILDGLRDRGGVEHLPPFFIGEQPDYRLAFYNDTSDAIFINADEVRQRGLSVERLLRDPAAQANFAWQFQDIIAHELVHAVQARRSILEENHFKAGFETEKEAYLVEHFYEHERLKADPQAPIPRGDLAEYELILDARDGYFDNLHDAPDYRNDAAAPTPTFLAYMEKVRAGWQAHRVEGYRLLAEHFSNVPALRERLLKKAAAVQATLP